MRKDRPNNTIIDIQKGLTTHHMTIERIEIDQTREAIADMNSMRENIGEVVVMITIVILIEPIETTADTIDPWIIPIDPLNTDNNKIESQDMKTVEEEMIEEWEDQDQDQTQEVQGKIDQTIISLDTTSIRTTEIETTQEIMIDDRVDPLDLKPEGAQELLHKSTSTQETKSLFHLSHRILRCQSLKKKDKLQFLL